MKVEILTIGDEVLAGNVLDTNTHFLADQLWLNGFFVDYHSAVRDVKTDIIAALDSAASRSDCVFVTGGLGPTQDDLTIAAANELFKTELVCDASALKHLEQLYASWGRTPTDNNRRQAYVPSGSKVFINHLGTAPGVLFVFKNKPIYFMPGVPKEMKSLFSDQMLPDLLARIPQPYVFTHCILRCFGMAESALDMLVRDLYTKDLEINDVRVGFRASYPETLIKLSAWGKTIELAQNKLNSVVDLVENKVGTVCYGKNEHTLETCVGQLLNEKNKTLAVAESCTGGFLGHRITNVSGSSTYFLGGVLSYANEVKKNVLGVDKHVLDDSGAVSEACAREMALGVKKMTQSDYALSITGIAGPTGGSAEKPVGLVYIGLAGPNGVFAKEFKTPDRGRDYFKLMASSLALNMLRKELIGLK